MKSPINTLNKVAYSQKIIVSLPPPPLITYQLSAQKGVKGCFPIKFVQCCKNWRFYAFLSQPLCLPLAENRLIPTELRREALALQGSLEFDDAGGEGDLPGLYGPASLPALEPINFRVIPDTPWRKAVKLLILKRSSRHPHGCAQMTPQGPSHCVLPVLFTWHSITPLCTLFCPLIGPLTRNVGSDGTEQCHFVHLCPQLPGLHWYPDVWFIPLFNKYERNHSIKICCEVKESVTLGLNRIWTCANMAATCSMWLPELKWTKIK